MVIAHGSRAKETEAALDSVVASARKKTGDAIIETAFMEFSGRTVEKGVSALALKGVDEIRVVPYFLFMGVHMKKDIPEMVAKCAAAYPNVKITMGEPIGADERLSDILADRITR